MMTPMSTLPVRRRWAVLSGTTTVSSWSRPIDAWPCDFRRPITWQENCLMRMSLPIGLAAPNSSDRTVSPMTHTALPAFSPASVKARPAAIVQLPAAK